jgi:hypothetical protein
MASRTLEETLFAASTVRLFGHTFDGLRLVTEDAGAKADPAGTPTAPQGTNLRGAPSVLRMLQEQLRLRNGGTAVAPGLARIYGFSYQGSYYKLAEPVVLLVHGDGVPVPSMTKEAALGMLGIEFNGVAFANDVMMWAQDQADYSVRIDITPGWLADVLLEPAMNDGTNMTTGRAG